MAKIAWLSFSPEGPEQRFSRFINLAADLGHEIYKPRFDLSDLQASSSELLRAVETGDAYLIPSPEELGHPLLLRPLRDRITKGHRALFAVRHPSSNQEENAIIDTVLAPYGMSPAGVRIRPPRGYSVVLNRTMTGYRESELLKGVNTIDFPYPDAILHHEDTTPVVVIDDEGVDDSIMPVGEDDYLRDRETLRRLSPFVIWRDQDGPGTVLGIYGFAPFCDPYQSLSGPFPCFDANPVFAQRIIEFLTNGIPKSKADLLSMLEQSEINLLEAILAVCEPSCADWWEDCVPEKVRKKCQEKAAQDKYCPSKYSALTIIDMKTIIESNRQLFSEVFLRARLGTTKREQLGWIDRFNNARNIVMHPPKSHFGQTMPMEEVRMRFQEAVDCSRRLLEAAKVASSGSGSDRI